MLSRLPRPRLCVPGKTPLILGTSAHRAKRVRMAGSAGNIFFRLGSVHNILILPYS